MNCPTCPDTRLVIADRTGIEIDHCPTCRGVWLDRGELDKIIARTQDDWRVEAPSRRPDPVPAQRWDDDDDWRRDDDRRPRRRRRSMLGELFDF